MPIVTAISPRVAAMQQPLTTSLTAQLSLRKSVYDLTFAEVNAFRKALLALAAVNDDRGYQYIAGIHGYPLPVYCRHGSPLFAVWHRAYLHVMEKALQTMSPGVALPYWDWTSPRALVEGVPKIYSDATYIDPDSNASVPNPLFTQPILFAGSEYAQTSRSPGASANLDGLSRLVDIAQRTNDYVNYSRNLENPHNGLHGWAGGTMSLIPYAAYDALFWAHHANIDRLFAQWQTLHPGISPPPEILQAVLAPFSVTVSDIWSIENLAYSYVTSPEPTQPAQGLLSQTMTGQTASFPLIGVRERFIRAELRFRGVLHPKNSIEVRVFANTPDPIPQTPTSDNPLYCGSLYLFGHGICAGDEGHCDVPDVAVRDVFDIRPPHHLSPMDLVLDIGDTLAWMLSQHSTIFGVSVVVVNNRNEQCDPSTFVFDELTLVAD